MWRTAGECCADCCVVQHDKFVMVWAGISIEGQTDLHVINGGALSDIRYRDKILHPMLSGFAGAEGDDFI